MKTRLCLLFGLFVPLAALAQPLRTDATLRITVVDPSGAVIVGATVSVRPAQGARSPIETGARGDATFTGLEPGRFTIHVECPGFEPSDGRDVRLRAGDTHREVKLKIAKLAETVQVGQIGRAHV